MVLLYVFFTVLFNKTFTYNYLKRKLILLGANRNKGYVDYGTARFAVWFSSGSSGECMVFIKYAVSAWFLSNMRTFKLCSMHSTMFMLVVS